MNSRAFVCLIGIGFSLPAGVIAPEPIRAANTCDMRRAAETPARFVAGGVLVPVRVNGAAAQMMLDTGSSNSMLDTEAAKSFSLEADPHRRTTLQGAGGQTTTQNAIVRSFDVGGWEWGPISLTTGRLAHEFNETPPVIGLLGADRLSNFDVELDVPGGRMTLWNVAHCDGDFVRWDAPHYVVPLVRGQANLMTMRIELNGHPVTAAIDWGAARTVVTEAAAATTGVTPDLLAHDWAVTAWGIDQNRLQVHLHGFDTMKIGEEMFRRVALTVANVHLPAGAALGVDFARTRRIWLSYATNRMFVAPLNAPGALVP